MIDSRSSIYQESITYIHFREILQVPRILDRCTWETANIITNTTFKENDKIVVKTTKLQH